MESSGLFPSAGEALQLLNNQPYLYRLCWGTWQPEWDGGSFGEDSGRAENVSKQKGIFKPTQFQIMLRVVNFHESRSDSIGHRNVILYRLPGCVRVG